MTLGERAATGVAGLDDVLHGGLPRDRIYLIEGSPGVGKTTLALEFLLEGIRRGEPGLYISLSETAEEIRAVAASHGWSLDKLALFELSAAEQSMGIENDNTLFEPSEVELQETTRTLLARVEEVKPLRVVFDSLSELRLLAQSSLRFRRQILALKQHFAGRRSTVVLLDDLTSEPGDLQLQSLAHGVIMLEQVTPSFGTDRRRLRVVKLRGSRFRSGYHEFTIETGGARVFPRLIAAEHHEPFERDAISSGVEGLDNLLGGGLHRGTSTLVIGPAGSGKSTIAAHYAVAAAKRDEHAAIFAFDESLSTLKGRAHALGLPLEDHARAGRIHLQQIDPSEMGPSEFVWTVRRLVEEQQVQLVVIDSLNGLLLAMPEEQQLAVQIHELLTYLGQRGVATVLVMAQHGTMGQMQTPVDVSYLADAVVMTRYFEASGRILKAVSCLKKRSGSHENSIREMSIDAHGLRVGPALEQFAGILTGVPRFQGPATDLLARE